MRNGRHWLHLFEHFYKMNQTQVSTLEVYEPTRIRLGNSVERCFGGGHEYLWN